MNFKEVDEARRTLGLSEAATLKEIKSVYRRLAHHHHPDKHVGTTEEKDEMMSKLNRAYQLLINYCTDYKYSFKEEDIARTYPNEDYWRKWQESWRM